MDIRIIRHKFAGAALQMVILIALVITVICASMLLLTYYHQRNHLEAVRAEQLQLDIQNATQFGLSKQFQSEDMLWVDTTILKQDSVQMRQESWGLYEVLSLQAFHGTDTLKKAFLIGRSLQEPHQVLYVVDEDRPLSISGESKITGDAYLPKAGMRSAYVEGKYYDKDKPLVYGRQLMSDKSMPQIDLAQFKKLFKDFNSEDSLGIALKFCPDSQSFFKNKILVHQKVIHLDKHYSGKIVFTADSLIEVGAEAQLNQVILVAPVVKIKGGSPNQVQIFARDSVVLSDGVKLEYPSAICLYREKAAQNQFSAIRFEKNVDFEGTILARGEDSNYLKYQVNVGENCHVKGLVDVDGTFSYHPPANFQMGLRTKRLICQMKGLLYENYLIDLKLNVADRPPSFLSNGILDQKGQKAILTWLN